MASELRWPSSYGSVYEGLVPGELLQQLRKEASAVAQCPNFWTPQEALLEHARPCTAFEAAIEVLHAALARGRLPHGCAGAEWWVQVYEPGKGLPFHFDKDEHLFQERREMVHPVLSSILYLSGAAAAQQRLGPTVIVDQRFDNRSGRPQPDSPQRSVLIYPRRGHFAAFDGRLGHGVLGSSSREQRVTLLINWWAHKPQDVDPITEQHTVQHSMAVRRWGSSCEVQCSAVAAALGKLALEPGGAESLPVPLLRLPPATTDSAAFTVHSKTDQSEVDDLLESGGHRLTGKAACSTVAIEHAGYALYPLADGDTADQQAHGLQTAAAFVPLHMLNDDDNSESSGGA